MKKLMIAVSLMMLVVNCAEAENMKSGENNAVIEIVIGDEKAEGIVYDNNAGKSFLKLLPLRLTLSDYNNTEKISIIGNKIDISDMPSSFDPDISDIAFYEPWGNICVFYKDFRLSHNLYSIGKVTKGIELFAKQKNDFAITVKRK